MSAYTTQQVADLIGLTTPQVRHVVRRGLLVPDRGKRDEYRFSFRHLTVLREYRNLIDTIGSVRKAIAIVRKTRVNQKVQGQNRVYVEGSNVVIREANSVWDIESGQGFFNFVAQSQATKVRALESKDSGRLLDRVEFSRLDSDDWYNLGLELEELDPVNAPEAYARSIGMNPKNADAHVNLGRLFQLRGDLKRAKRHYQLALVASPNHQLAHYNMGTVFDELDEIETAKDFYAKAVQVPDAHYNLARIFEMSGDQLASLRHLKRYRQLLDSD